MKRILIYVSLSLLSIIVIAAIVWKMFFSAPDLAGLVPSDATAIVKVDVKTIIEDAGVPKTALKGIDNDTGLDFAHPIYAFRRGAGVGFVAAVDESDEFDEKLSERTQRSGYTFGSIGGFVVCHDDERMLCMGPLASLSDKALLDEMVKIMRFSQQSSPLLDRLKTHDTPVAAVVSAEALPQSLYAIIDKTTSHGFDTDSLVFEFEGSVSERSIKMSLLPVCVADTDDNVMSKLLDTFLPITGTMVYSSPQDPAVWLCMGVRGESMLKKLRLIPKLRTALLGLNMCIDADMMLKATEGDVMVSFPKVSLQKQPWVMLAEVKNTKFMRNRSSWNTRGLNFDIDIMGNNILALTSSDAEKPRQDIMSPNTSLTILKSKMIGQRIFLTIDVPKVLNPLKPALAVFGYGNNLFEALDMLERINISIGDEESNIEIVLNQTIKEIVEQWNQ